MDSIKFTKEHVNEEYNYVILKENSDCIDKYIYSNKYIEIQYVYSGKISQDINDEEIILEQGSLCIFNKDINRFIKTITNEAIVYHIFINKDLFDTKFFALTSEDNIFSSYIYKSLYLENKYDKYILVSNLKDEIINIIDLLYSEIKNKHTNYNKALYAYTTILFIRLYRYQYGLQNININLNDISRKKEQIPLILDYIQKFYKTASLSSTSKALFLHPNYLCKIIKDETGKTFTEILNETKMKKAKLLLGMTKKSVDSISLEVGYSNPNYFYKLFKRYYGITPGQYRENISINKLKYNNNIYNTEDLKNKFKKTKGNFLFTQLAYKSGKLPRIAFMPAGTEYNYYREVGRGINAVAKKMPAHVFTLAPKSGADINGQMKMLYDAVRQKVDAIIISTHDENAAAPLIKKAVGNGIMVCVINYDRPDFPVPVHAIVGYKQRKGTYKIGEYAIEIMKEKQAKVGIIQGLIGYHSSERCGGFLDAIKGQPNFEIISILNGNWNEEGGYNAALSMLETNPEINLIFCANDHEAVGAVEAIRKLNKKNIIVLSNDGDISGLEYVAHGLITATVYTNPYKMGETAIQVVLNGLAGEFKGGHVETPIEITDITNVIELLQNR